MPERPLLALAPEAEERRPSGSSPNPPRPLLPSKDRQQVRIGPIFRRLEEAFEIAETQGSVSLRATPDGIEPERTLVFEVVGATADLARAVANLPGLEFELEEQLEFEADEDFRKAADDESPVSGRLYACIPDIGALRQMLSLWDLYQRGEALPHGLGRWKELFAKLRTIRPWGPEDRLPEATREFITTAVEQGRPTVRLETELWFRTSPEKRQESIAELREAAPTVELLSECVIEEIRYHAVLLDLSPDDALNLLGDPASGVGSAAGVMLIKPQSLVEAAIGEVAIVESDEPAPAPFNDADSPIRIAVLDGMPLHRHQLLDGRILLDDPDGFEGSSPPAKRLHGTAMASLVLNGDLNRPSQGPHTIYLRPILEYDDEALEERTPREVFPLDLVHRAVKRIKEGEAQTAATCPTAVVINLSLGDENQPFVQRASPWAKLIDFLSHKYRVLFVVSAGNITTPALTTIPTLTAFEALSEDAREREVLTAIFRSRGTRSMLSPAEAANAITVGASFGDAFPAPGRTGAMAFRPYVTQGLPNLSSGLGLGVRRSVKPDMVFEGGKEPVHALPSPDGIRIAPGRSGSPFFGHKVAAPSAAGQLDQVTTSSGSSDAAALVTNGLSKVLFVLDPAGDEDSLQVPDDYLAVTAKALAIHSCSWGEAGERIGAVVGPTAGLEWRRRRYNVSSGLGCGQPFFGKVIEGARNRAVMVHWGQLAQDQSRVFRIPIPGELNGLAEYRRVTITVAWLSPINPSRAQHRMARFEIDPVDDAEFWIGEKDKALPIKDSFLAGTSVQMSFEGEDVIALAHADGLGFRVSCRAQYDRLREPVSFGLAVTLELAENTAIDVYERVRVALRERVRAQVPVRA